MLSYLQSPLWLVCSSILWCNACPYSLFLLCALFPPTHVWQFWRNTGRSWRKQRGRGGKKRAICPYLSGKDRTSLQVICTEWCFSYEKMSRHMLVPPPHPPTPPVFYHISNLFSPLCIDYRCPCELFHSAYFYNSAVLQELLTYPQSLAFIYGLSPLDVAFDRPWWNVSSPHHTRPRQALSLKVESGIEDRTRKRLSPLSIHHVNLSSPYPSHWSDNQHILYERISVWWSQRSSWQRDLTSSYHWHAFSWRYIWALASHT